MYVCQDMHTHADTRIYAVHMQCMHTFCLLCACILAHRETYDTYTRMHMHARMLM